jgi:YD repeat-containing protein
VNLVGGLLGLRDPTGRVVEQGWAALGFPTEQTCAAGRDYESLRRNV